MPLKTLPDLLIHEFVTQYMPDELPPGWPNVINEAELDEMARGSALRLMHTLSLTQKTELIALLQKSNNDIDNSLKKNISQSVLIDWSEEEYVPLFQTLLERIIFHVQRHDERTAVPNTDQLLQRLAAVKYQTSYEDDDLKARLMKEHLRRLSLWWHHLKKDETWPEGWPFVDVTAWIEPEFETSSQAAAQLDDILTPHAIGWRLSGMLKAALRWATFQDSDHFQLAKYPSFLPLDPYLPVVAFFERGGDVHFENGTIHLPIAGFRVESPADILGKRATIALKLSELKPPH